MPPRVLVARDLSLLLLACVALVLDAHLRATIAQSALTITVGVIAGVLVAVAGFIGHEWGHLAGSLLTKSAVHYPQTALSPLLFHFDTKRNDRAQFLAMSWGGYIATALGTALVVAIVDARAWSGRVALVLTVGGMIVTLVAEVPTTVRVLLGRPLPDGFAFRPPRA
jgi:hypothetical protein